MFLLTNVSVICLLPMGVRNMDFIAGLINQATLPHTPTSTPQEEDCVTLHSLSEDLGCKT
ncbi:hypothetical protein [Tolypothrix bouteillei]|uniref:hypothetical protein n=1 Tax=Tolypothrix bouteillei TaxID=1246981 RepID=UPI0016AEC14B